MSSFSIRDEQSNSHLTISLPPSDTLASRCVGYIEVEVEIQAGKFGGSYRTQFSGGDLPWLQAELRKLYDNLSGRLSFCTLEYQLEFKITGDGRGHFEAECEAQESVYGSRLIFTLKFDPNTHSTHNSRVGRYAGLTCHCEGAKATEASVAASHQFHI